MHILRFMRHNAAKSTSSSLCTMSVHTCQRSSAHKQTLYILTRWKKENLHSYTHACMYRHETFGILMWLEIKLFEWLVESLLYQALPRATAFCFINNNKSCPNPVCVITELKNWMHHENDSSFWFDTALQGTACRAEVVWIEHVAGHKNTRITGEAEGPAKFVVTVKQPSSNAHLRVFK